MGDSNRLIRIAELFNGIDANLAKGALENSNVFCQIEGEHTADLGITITGIGNQIYLKVLEKDLSKAVSIIKNLSVPLKLMVDEA